MSDSSIAMRSRAQRKTSVPSTTRRLPSTERQLPLRSESLASWSRVDENMTDSPLCASCRWDNDDGPRRLREVQEETEEKEYDIKGAREEVGKLEKEVKEVETSLYQADKTRKNIDDNIRHRLYKARIRTAKEEIKDLNVEESTEARNQYERKYTKSKQKEQSLVSQVSPSSRQSIPG